MNESDLLNKMADIELPAPPDWQPFIIVAAGVMLLIVLAVVLIARRIYKNNKTGTAESGIGRLGKKVLDEIEDQWSAGRIDDREASYRLATLLRLGLGLPQLNLACPSGLIDDTHTWEQTIQLFHQLRYRKITASRLSTDDFRNVRIWLTLTANNNQQPC